MLGRFFADLRGDEVCALRHNLRRVLLALIVLDGDRVVRRIGDDRIGRLDRLHHAPFQLVPSLGHRHLELGRLFHLLHFALNFVLTHHQLLVGLLVLEEIVERGKDEPCNGHPDGDRFGNVSDRREGLVRLKARKTNQPRPTCGKGAVSQQAKNTALEDRFDSFKNRSETEDPLQPCRQPDSGSNGVPGSLIASAI